MATESLSSVPLSSNPYVRGLTWGDRWDLSSGAVTYDFYTGGYFLNNFPSVTGVGDTWLASEMSAVNRALSAWRSVCNISFQRQTGGSTDIGFFNDTLGDFAGISDTPSSPSLDVNVTVYDWSIPSWSTPGALNAGGTGFETILHEIGHAIGLAHPHDSGGASTVFPGVTSEYDTGTYGLNQDLWTVMSYVSFSTHTSFVQSYTYGNVYTPMALDIAAVQAIYGANMSYHTGANTYVLPDANRAGTGYMCIWDAGGADTISAAGKDGAARINLNDAPLAGPNAGGYLSSVRGVYGGVTIANGVVIERAIGGNGADILTGNEFANLLLGNRGNDRISAGYGNDQLDGGQGSDVLNGGTGNDRYVLDVVTDRIVGEGLADLGDSLFARFAVNLSSMYGGRIENAALTGGAAISVTGNGRANRLTGNGAANTLTGLGGNDLLDGRAGNDILRGGTGNDVYILNSSADRIDERGGGGTTDTIRAAFDVNLGLISGSIATEILQLIGSGSYDAIGNIRANTIYGNAARNILNGMAGDDRLFGNSGNDSLIGGTGNDYLNGGLGADTMSGGAGNDTYVVDNSFDRVNEFANQGIDTVHSTISFSLGATVENLTLEGADNINGAGNALANRIVGNGGDNIISGGDAADILIGGGGADNLTGGNGDDQFVFAGIGDTPVAAADLITDFDAGVGSLDEIDLSAIDADVSTVGDDAFTFNSTLGATLGAHEIVFSHLGGETLIEGDVDGDAVADFNIRLSGNLVLDASDFVL